LIKKDSKSTETGTALVTGGAKRIGASISKHLAKSGWNVIIHFNTNKKAAIQLRSKIIKLGGSAEIIKADLSKEKHVKELIPRIKKKYGDLSLLINNASIFERDNIAKLKEYDWNRNIEINVKAPLFLSKYFYNSLSKNESGIIINIVDQGVLNNRPDFISYYASKNSLWYLTKTLAQTFSPKVRVCALGPGPTLKNSRQTNNDFIKQIQSLPLRKGPNLEEINMAVDFIIFSYSFTGQMITLDGGEHLKWEVKKSKIYKE